MNGINAHDSLLLYVDSVKLINKSGHATYTIPVKQTKAYDLPFRNLIIDIYDGEVSTFIATYTPNAKFLTDHLKGLNPIFSGKMRLDIYDMNSNAGGMQIQSQKLRTNLLLRTCITENVYLYTRHVLCTGGGNHEMGQKCECDNPQNIKGCNPGYDVNVYMDLTTCYEIEYDGYTPPPSGGGGGGGGTSPTPPPNYDPCPPVAVESSGLKVQKVDGETPCETPTPPPVVIPTMFCSFDMCRDTSITNNLRLNKIFNYLDGVNPVFDSLATAYKNSYNYDLKFSQGNLPGLNGYTYFAGLNNGSNAGVFVTLDRSFVNDHINGPFIDIVRTILHETWHAELFQMVYSKYGTNDLQKIQQHYGRLISSLTVQELIDLLAVDINGSKALGTFNLMAMNGWDKTQQHNYMVKNINVMARGINQFLVKINSPLANNMEFAYAEALSTLMPVSTYFNDPANIVELASHFPNYHGPESLKQYINHLWSVESLNIGPLN